MILSTYGAARSYSSVKLAEMDTKPPAAVVSRRETLLGLAAASADFLNGLEGVDFSHGVSPNK